jgi:S-DNA-T family DNA segregation ATPase FtsK/SpoIIIE
MPYIVTVIDEFADLTMAQGMGGDTRKAAISLKEAIIRLAQKGRAAGIHVILATQRPEASVVSGLIKSNCPTKIAFKVSTGIDSKVIIDGPGAEKLIGRGDMLLCSGVDKERVQCAMVSMDEIERITRFIGAQTKHKACYTTPYYLPVPPSDNEGASAAGDVDMTKLDEHFEEAARMIVLNQRGSTSDLQRRLGLGYARAGKLMDQLEAAGIVGPQSGSKPREILVSDFAELDGILDAYLQR